MGKIPKLTPEQQEFVDSLIHEYWVLKKENPHYPTTPFLLRCRNEDERDYFRVITDMSDFLEGIGDIEDQIDNYKEDKKLFGEKTAGRYLKERLEKRLRQLEGES